MTFKLIALFAVVAVASAVHVPSYTHHAAPAYHQSAPAYHHVEPVYHHEPEHHAPAHYDFAYSVHDEHTGDIKSQQESRKGDAVHGSYSLIDADGYKRTVEYTADDHNGFQATVHREPVHHHHAPAPAVHLAPAPVHYAAPAHNHYHY